MGRLKYWKTVCFATFLCLLLCGGSMAAEVFSIKLERYRAEDNRLYLYVGQSPGEDRKLPESIVVTAGGIELPVQKVSALGETKEPVYFVCLADVSGTISDSGVEYMKETIQHLAGLMNENDRISLATVSDETVFCDWMKGEEIQPQIEKLARTGKDTNLYAGIVDALKFIKERTADQAQGCLVIFSDGEDDFRTGITREEAMRETEQSNIPVFTVAILKSKPARGEDEISKQFGSFARTTPEGIAMVPIIEDLTEQQAAESVRQGMDSIMVVEADLTGYQGVSEIWLEVTMTLSGGQTGKSGMYIPGSKLEEAMVQMDSEASTEETRTEGETLAQASESGTEGETLAQPSESGQANQEDEAGTSYGTFLLLGGIAATLLIAGAVVFASRKWRKKKGELRKPAEENALGKNNEKTMNEGQGTLAAESDREKMIGAADAEEGKNLEAAETADKADEETADKSAGETTDNTAAGAGEKTTSKTMSNTANKPAGGIDREETMSLCLIEMGQGKELREKAPFVIQVGREFRIGRDPKKCDLAISDDYSLSGCHCILSFQQGHLWIKDMGSTNGTYVNGVPVKEVVMLELQDRIMIGSREYRIYQE